MVKALVFVLLVGLAGAVMHLPLVPLSINLQGPPPPIVPLTDANL